jgi:pimeloyl-ACP methyl ester carboxylesterase
MATSYLQRPGGRLAYEVVGPEGGPLVVAVHGMGSNRHAFRLLVPLLVDKGLRVASLDLRGHGESSPVWSEYGVTAVADDLLELVQQLGGPAVLVANSVSCASVTYAAAKSPADVAGLVLIDGTAARRQLNPLMRGAFALVGRNATLWGMFYRSLFKAGFPADHAEDTARLLRELREPGRMTAVRRVLDQPPVWWTEAAAPSVTCPVQVVMGTKDPDFADPSAEARAIVAAFTDTPAQLVLVEGSGHYPYLDNPNVTNPAIATFAAKIRA